MRSITDIQRRDLVREKISTYWFQMENSEHFDEVAIYIVEVPMREYKRPEVIEAKAKEIENLEKYGVFEEMKYEGQETVGSRWVITKKRESRWSKAKF